MASTINKTGHGLIAGDAFQFANVLPTDSGIDEGTVYYVLASGLTADAFQFSETDGGAAFTLTNAIDSGDVVAVDTYEESDDDVMFPPEPPAAPGSCVLTSTAVLAPDGTVASRLTITIAQPVSATLRHTVVTVTGGSNEVKVVIPVGETVGTVPFVVPGITYTGTAVAYDTFGLESDATVSAGHVAAGDTTAPATPTGLAASNGILSITAVWTAQTEDDLSHYDIQIDDNSGFTSPTTYSSKTNFLTIGELAVGTWYVKVRAVDLTGNASAYTSSQNAVSRITDEVENTGATVVIDASGITIEDGALTFLDEFGTTVLNGGGFGRPWVGFLYAGFYNAFFETGLATDIPVSEVGGGSGSANYADSISTDLPYWVVAASGTTLKIITDTAFIADTALQSTVTAGTGVDRIYQDLPVFGEGRRPMFLYYSVTRTSGTVKLGIRYSYRDKDHVIIGSASAFAYSTFTATQGHSLMVYEPATVAPDNAAYIRYEVEVDHSVSGTNSVQIGSVYSPNDAEPSFLEVATEKISAGPFSIGYILFQDHVDFGNHDVIFGTNGAFFGNVNVFGSGFTMTIEGFGGDAIVKGRNSRYRIDNDSTTDIAFDSVVNGDSVQRWKVDTDGDMAWGAGSGAVDIGIRRDVAGRLNIEGLSATEPRMGLTLSNGHATNSSGFFVWNSGDTVARALLGKYTSGAPGVMFGSGSATDAGLYRPGAGVNRFLGRLSFDADSVISPAQLTANTDDYDPADLATSGVLRITASGAINLTGIAADSGNSWLLLINSGTNTITLKHDVTSTAANRFYCKGAADYALTSRSSALLFYDSTSSRWRVLGTG